MLTALVGCNKQAPPDIQASKSGQQQAGQSGNITPDPTSRPDDKLVDSATFIFTSDFEAFQRPCGCAIAQHGGLPRLGAITQTVGDALRGQDTTELADFGVSVPDGMSGEHKLWLVDCGNYSDAARRMPGLRVKWHLAALAEAGAVAAVVNQNELLLSETQAATAFAGVALPVVCCNVTPSIPGVEFSDSVKLAENWYLVGLAAEVQSVPAEGQGGWWEFHNPMQSVERVLEGLPEGANVVVAAAHQPPETLHELQKLNVRAVVGGEADARPGVEVADGLAPLLETPSSRGSKLQLLSIDSGLPGGYQPWFVVAGEEWHDDPGVGKTLKAFQAELREQLAIEMAALYGEGGFDNITWGMDSKYLPPSDKAEHTFTGLHHVGVETCKECHRDEYGVWRKSRHAFAWDSLVAVSEQETLDCLSCHTTGMFQPGGYYPFAPSDKLVSVGCESCHGAGSEHVEWAQAGADSGLENKITQGSLEACLDCHDSYNSPDFDASAYWEAVAH